MSVSIKHNKKRNTGLIKEFFARSMADSLISDNIDRYKKTCSVFKLFFSKNKEIYKEARLFDLLLTQKGLTKDRAKALLDEVRLHVSRQDTPLLENEKYLLLKEINKSLVDDSFFEREVKDYKILATIQSVFNYWRNPTMVEDIGMIFKFENLLIDRLTSNELSTDATASSSSTTIKEEVSSALEVSKDITPVVLKLMQKKYAEKYKSTLTSEQKEILGMYLTSNNKSTIKEMLLSIQQKTMLLIEKYIKENESTEQYLIPKLKEVLSICKQKEYDLSNVDEQITESQLLLSLELVKLQKELTA